MGVVKNPTDGVADTTATIASAALAADARTRDRVARSLLEHGPSTAASLAERLGLTSAGVRRHLDAMIADGLVAEVSPRKVHGASRGRGRPARLFGLTESGRAAFPHSYDDLAAEALRFVAEQLGPPAVHEFARARVAALEERYRARIADLPTARERAAVLAAALTSDGYAASTADAGSGTQLCQHHCPVQHVAEAFPQLCEAETAVFSRLLGTHVQRLATIAHGDGVCTTHVPGEARIAAVSTSNAERTRS
jgi:predicted ArsR family transcriptional regulator